MHTLIQSSDFHKDISKDKNASNVCCTLASVAASGVTGDGSLNSLDIAARHLTVLLFIG